MMKKLIHFLRHHASWSRPVQTDTGLHIPIGNETEKRIYSDVFIDRDYDLAINTMLSSAGNSTLNILDLGCNAGYFILRLIHLARKSGHKALQVIGIDASQKLCLETTRRLERSGLSDDFYRIEILNGLIGSSTGSGTFYHFKDHGLSSVFRTSGESQQIDFIDVDRIVRNWDIIHLLKCDIEGSEFAFITHYPQVLRKVKSAVIEFHPEFCDYKKCIALLYEAGLVNSVVIREMPFSNIQLFSR